MTTYTDADGNVFSAGQQHANDQFDKFGGYVPESHPDYPAAWAAAYEAEAPSGAPPLEQLQPLDGQEQDYYSYDPSIDYSEGFEESPQEFDLFASENPEQDIRGLIRDELGELNGYGYEDPEQLAAEAEYQMEQAQAHAHQASVEEEHFREEEFPGFVADALPGLNREAAELLAPNAWTIGTAIGEEVEAQLMADTGLSQKEVRDKWGAEIAAHALVAGTRLSRSEMTNEQMRASFRQHFRRGQA
jgi:hypothetical protein